jgi:MFS transporter, DHA1 family, inner membrane transport protein
MIERDEDKDDAEIRKTKPQSFLARPTQSIPRRSWLALLLICSAVFCAFVSIFAVPPLMGTLTRQFHVSYSKAGLFMTAYTMIPTFGSLLIGFLTDRIGVRRSVLTGLGLLALSGFCAAASQTFLQMLACRTLMGIGATIIFVPGLATVLYLLPVERVNIATGAFFGALNLGLTLAMLTTPIIAAVTPLGWRVPFAVYAILAVLVLAIIFFFTNERFFQPSQQGAGETMQRSAQKSSSKLALVLVSAGNCFLFFQSFGMITWLPAYLAEQRKFPPVQAGAISMLLGLVVIPGSILAGWLADRTGAWLVAMLGASLCAICPVLLIFGSGLKASGVAIDVFFVALGTSLLTIPLTSVLARLVSSQHGGKAVGLILTTGYGGALVSTSLGGYLLTATGVYTWTFMMCTVAMVLTLGLLLGLRPTYERLEKT